MERLLIGALAAGAAIWGYGLWNLVDNARVARSLAARPWDGGPAPRVSIVLPARNEAHQIRACVESLRAQDYPNWELVVVDDRSEDGTGSILAEIAASEPRMRVLSGTELPPGWMGKSWANHQGVAKTQGEWLLFTDADTWHDPSALSTFMRYALEEGADMVSTAPFQVCETFWEKVVQPGVMLTTLMFKPVRTLEDPSRLDTLANGQYVLIRRSTFEAVGGHEAIRASVVDDISLASVVQQSGAKLKLPQGASLVKVRMYTGFQSIWEGWSKNFFGAIKANLFLAMLAPVVWSLSSILPWLGLPYFAWQALSGRGDGQALLGLGLSAGVVAVTVAVRALALRAFCSLGPMWSLAHPLSYAMLSLFMLNSLRRGLLGRGPQWKGRVYPGMHA